MSVAKRSMNNMQRFRIDSVSRLTGLSKVSIRAWERRYGIIKPIRRPNGFREYTEADIGLLRFLKQETERGAKIGELVSLTQEELTRRAHGCTQNSVAADTSVSILDDLLSALDPLDATRFERRLNEAVSMVPFEEALGRTLLPLQLRVGELWHENRLSVAVEHFVTKQIQQRLFVAIHQLKVAEFGPRIVIACPKGEHHEIAAMMVAYIAVLRGWRAFYLGGDVPIADLANFCQRVCPALTALSLVNQMQDGDAECLANMLAVSLLPFSPLILGGAGAKNQRSIFERMNISVLDNLTFLESRLLQLSAKYNPAVRLR